MSKYQLLSVFTLSLALIGCGGGGGGGGSDRVTQPVGYTGSTQRATASTSNQEALSVASAEGVKQAIDNGDVPLPLASVISKDSLIDNLLLTVQEQLISNYSISQLPTGIVLVESCTNGGEIEFDVPGVSQNAQTLPQNGTANVDFRNCNEGGDVINGTSTFNWNGYDNNLDEFISFTYTYSLTISSNGSTETISGALTCTDRGTNCTVSDDFSEDGVQYRIEQSSISGNNVSGYSVSARVYDENEGYVDINATNITVCSNGNIATGTITITDGTNTDVIEVTFPNCDDCIVTFNGVSTVYQQ